MIGNVEHRSSFWGNLITISARICRVLKKKKKTVGEGQIKRRLAFTNCFSFLVRKYGRNQRSWYSYFKVPKKGTFLVAYLKELSKWWRMALIYCDSTLGCRVIQDYDLCKLDDLWRHFVWWTRSDVKSHKKLNLSQLFLYRAETWSFWRQPFISRWFESNHILIFSFLTDAPRV